MVNCIMHTTKSGTTAEFSVLPWSQVPNILEESRWIIPTCLWLNVDTPKRVGARHFEMKHAKNKYHPAKTVLCTVFDGTHFSQSIYPFFGR